MVECREEDWDDTENGGWDDDDMDEDGPGIPDAQFSGPVDEKGFKFVQAHVMKSRVTQGLEEYIELFAMDIDQLIVVARHFKWQQDNMQVWFADQDRLKYKLGLEPDPMMARSRPESTASLKTHHGGYCTICYS